MKLSVVMPVYNEVNTIETILSAVQAAPVDKEIILVDDFSTDGTRQKLQNLNRVGNIRVLLHEKNRGKGAALRTGFQAATGDWVVIQDADLEYDPKDYPKLIQPIVDGRADVVYGSRFAHGRPRGALWRSYLANRFLTCLSNLASGLRLTDMETCYKVFRREIIQAVNIEEDRFGFEPEVTAKIAAMGYRVWETSIRYEGRDYTEGKKIGLKDAFRALWCILKYNLRKNRFRCLCEPKWKKPR
jgi:glycosyltransferase involved in cell wall biosynthesis